MGDIVMKQSFFQKTWVIILLLFIFAPVGIWLLWKYKKDWGKIGRIVITACSVCLFILLFILFFGDTNSQNDVTENTNSSTSFRNWDDNQSMQSDNNIATSETFNNIGEEVGSSKNNSGESSNISTTKPIISKPTETTRKVVDNNLTANTTRQNTTKPDNSVITNESTKENVTTNTQKTTVSDTTKPSETQPTKETSTTKPTTTKTTTTKVTTTEDPDKQFTVYRTASGEKYHYENPCGNGTYYPISLADAKARGLEPCEKCVLH